MSRIVIAAAMLITGTYAVAAQSDVERAYAAFAAQIDTYVQMHRRIEGPVPPLAVSRDIAEVRKLMADVRRRIKHESDSEQGRFFTRDLTLALRKRIATVMTRQDVQALIDDVVEHTPPGLPAVRVYEALPADAPRAVIFVTVFGLSTAALEEVLEVVAREGRDTPVSPVFLTDSLDFKPFRKRRLRFEYLPDGGRRQRFAPDLDWPTYERRRYRLLAEKWRPQSVISFGTPPPADCAAAIKSLSASA